MLDERPNADELLKKIQNDDIKNNRGRLKIFFGFAAGVGKTYAMLENAHMETENGKDIVLGYIEPHARPQTAKLTDGFELLPTLEISHKGIFLKEFDLDGAIKRHPDIIVVDELAHTNAPGLRHEKRYQDVKELLDNGIDVYTTVNVQHIESLNDIVASITGIVVNERIPDKIFDTADQVELVDIEPRDLIKRLNSGNIYKADRAKKALNNFFTVQNLTALREIALRRTADRVNRIAEKDKQTEGREYFIDEHILVCLSSSPSNQKIIRTAARLANAFICKLTALFVETKNFEMMSDENKTALRKNINLAKSLGASIETVYGDDVALQIAEFARTWGVSKIVIGKSNTKRRFAFGASSFSEKISVYAPNLDIYIIPDSSTPKYFNKPVHKDKQQISAREVILSISILVVATLIGHLFDILHFSESNIIMVYILGVLLTAILTQRRIYSAVSSILSVLVFNFFFTDPRISLTAYDPGYPVTFAIMFICAFISSSLATKIKKHAKISSQIAYRTKILFETSQLLQKTDEKNEIISVGVSQITKLIKKDVVYYDVGNNALIEPKVYFYDAENSTDKYLTANEQAVANWVYKNNKHAGSTTDTLGSSECLYLAVRMRNTVYGVIGIPLKDDSLDTFENSMLLSIINELALALEKDKTVKQRQEALLQVKNEKLRANILRAVSHDLRTPLTGISGNAAILMQDEQNLSVPKRKELYTYIYDDSMWLVNLIENMLSITRLEEGSVDLQMQPELMNEVICEAMKHINRQSVFHKITVKQWDELLMAKMDARLIIQVIINIVDNAIKYTPEKSEIIISIKEENNMVITEIKDNGAGISDESKKKIFDMFYTGENKIADSKRSLGIGLALCKSIVIAHKGSITVSDNKPHGTVFRFSLPKEEVTLHE